MDDQQYEDYTSYDPNYYADGGQGYDYTDLSSLFGDTSYTPEVEQGYGNEYYNLADQLAQLGLTSQDSYGAPDLSTLLNMQYSDAIGSGSLGDITGYTPETSFDPNQMALEQANLVGSGYDSVLGNSEVVIDPATGELVDKSSLLDRMNYQKPNPMSAVNSRTNDFLAKYDYPHSTVDDMGNVIAEQGPYSAIYDPEDQASFDQAAGLVDFQAQPGGGRYDGRGVLAKLGGALSGLFKSSPAGNQQAQGQRQLPGNASNAATQGQRQAMSAAEMLAQMMGVMQKGKGASAAPGDDRRLQANNWGVSRKAISGRAKKASGGALGLLRGAQAGQADKVPIDASHGEYIFDADTVSALGDGNTEAGAAKLDEMRHNIRKHKRSASADKIPPKAKGALQYMRGGK